MIATKVGDNVSTKKTEIQYKTIPLTSIAEYGLVSEVRLYDGNNTLLKKSATTYNLDNAYVSRRIIGLSAQSILYDGNLAMIAKVTYSYDEFGFDGSGGLQQNISPVQHDNTNFGASFVVGRGNTTSVTRHDVVNASTITSNLKYNTAGAVVGKITPWDSTSTRLIKIDYTDNFNDGVNRNAFAYPKVLTDPAGYSSTVKYRFDTGANVEAQSPTPFGTGNSTGKQTTRLYDSIGRLEKEAIANTGAYTRYQYFDNGVQSKTFATITAGAGEAESETWTDGAGRTLKARSELPGSSGGWSGTLVEYDIAGRITRSTVPTEINSSWTPSGDDYRGVDTNNNPVWLWNSQEYDWKSRVTKKTNTDGTFQSITYTGCGCSGNLVTTIQGEEIFETDWNGSNPVSLGRRTQKIYEDVQGRTWKTEVLNWNNSVYSTTTTAFNGRDQATEIKQFEGDAASSVFQRATITYDGYGRIQTRHLPQQDTNVSTVYNYNPDDSISSVVDARGATTNYVYNSRGLVDTISYSVPSGSTISVPATVTFLYDDAGNRKKMTDGLGTVDYEYNELSQLTAETRNFSDTLANAPIPSTNGFRLEYEYTLSGQLKSIKDPFDDRIDYEYDKIGRLNVVNGTTFAGITNYADNPQYRAWGGLKSLDYSNNTQITMTFNNRLQVQNYELTKTGQQQPVMSKNYEYYPDGNIRKLDDLVNDKFDRLNTFDHAGRPKEAKTGIEARDSTVVLTQTQMTEQLPYRQNYQFNSFGNMTQRNNLHWGITTWQGESNNLSYTYQNNRITNTGWAYDADGRTTVTELPDADTDPDEEITWDAAGRLNKYLKIERNRMERFYNGNGKEEKRKEENWVMNTITGVWYWAEKPPEYFIRSTVFGGEVISEVDSTGKKKKTIVRGAGGAVLAWQTVNNYVNPATEYVNFQQQDASGFSYRSTKTDGETINGSGTQSVPAEFDPLGGSVGMGTPYVTGGGGPIPPEIPTMNYQQEWDYQIVNGQRVPCTLDGAAFSCGIIGDRSRGGFGNSDAHAPCPNNDCGPRVYQFNGQTTFSSPFQAGQSGDGGFRVPEWGNIGVQILPDGEDAPPPLPNPANDVIIGWKFVEVSLGNATWNPIGQTKDKKVDKLPEDFKKRVGDLITENCADFLKKFFTALSALKNNQEGIWRENMAFASAPENATVGSRKHIESLFDRIVNAKGFHIVNKLSDKGDVDGEASGSGKRRKVEILQQGSPNAAVGFHKYSIIALQEIVHHARESGKYSDSALDFVAREIASEEEKKLFRSISGSATKGAFGHFLVNQHCYAGTTPPAIPQNTN